MHRQLPDAPPRLAAHFWAWFPFGPPYTAHVLPRARCRGPHCSQLLMKIGTMKHWIACLSLLSLLVSGCDTVNHSQLQIKVPRGQEKTRLTVPASERDTVKQVITDIANKRHFEDRTEMSLVPDTICSFAQPDVNNPLTVRAWVSKQRTIIIDLVQKRPDAAGESQAYRTLRDQVMSDLEKQFGGRLSMVHKTKQAHSKTTPVQ